MAALFQRLMTVDCKEQTAAVIRHNGTAALEDGFAALGELAMTELMAHPAVETEIGRMSSEVDPAALQALSKEIVSAKE